MIASSLDLVGHVLGRSQRLWSEAGRDAALVAEQWAALVESARRAAEELRGAQKASPRFLRIVKDTLRIAATYRIQMAACRHLEPEQAAERMHGLHVGSAARMRDLCAELGGGVLKLGQLASCRMDVLPAPWIEALSALRDRAPAVPTEEIRARIEEELLQPTDEVFARFDDAPLAAASLAQVHAAELPDGRKVAVKVQRPGIEDVIETDIAAMRFVAAALPQLIPGVDLGPIALQVTRSLRHELDFEREATNAQDLARALQDDDRVIVPGVHRALSTPRLIVLELIEGRPLVDALEAEPERRDEVLSTLVDTFAAQVLRHGVVHADPHPGNLLMADDGRLALVDFGCMQRYTHAQRRAWADLAGAILGKDTMRVAELLDELGFEAMGSDPDALVTFARMFLSAFDEQLKGDLSAIDPLEQLEAMLALGRANPVRIPEHFVMLGRVFAALGGLVLHYRPRVDLFRLLMPHLAAAMVPSPA